MREAGGVLPRKADGVQERAHASIQLRAAHLLGEQDRLADGGTDRHARVERARRILEDDADAVVEAPDRLPVGARDVDPVDRQGSGVDREQPDGRPSERRLPRPRLPDEADDLAPRGSRGRCGPRRGRRAPAALGVLDRHVLEGDDDDRTLDDLGHPEVHGIRRLPRLHVGERGRDVDRRGLVAALAEARHRVEQRTRVGVRRVREDLGDRPPPRRCRPPASRSCGRPCRRRPPCRA